MSRRLAVHILYTERGHHGAFSGLHSLVSQFGAATLDLHVRPVRDCHDDGSRPRPWISSRIRAAANGLLHRRGRPWYGVTDLVAEAALLGPWLSGSIDVLHYLDGEHSARFLPGAARRLGSRGRTIATFHQPLSVLPDVVPPSLVRSVDGVTLMSASQRPYFAGLIAHERLTVIPHGVDTAFFVPRGRSRQAGPFRCLTTGSYLRDWAMLRSVAGALTRRKNVQFHVVSPDAPGLAGVPNVVLHRGITDAALRGEYQSADLFVLPLRDASANNALLEAMACGLPVVASDLPALREYTSGTAAALVPHATDAFVGAIERLVDDDATRVRMAEAARRCAESFAWPLVARRYERLYAQVAGSQRTA